MRANNNIKQHTCQFVTFKLRNSRIGYFRRMSVMCQAAVNLHFATGVLPDFDRTSARASDFACVAFLRVRPSDGATSPIFSRSVADQRSDFFPFSVNLFSMFSNKVEEQLVFDA